MKPAMPLSARIADAAKSSTDPVVAFWKADAVYQTSTDPDLAARRMFRAVALDTLHAVAGTRNASTLAAQRARQIVYCINVS